MRATAATEALTAALQAHFDGDVVSAFAGDQDMFEAVVRKVATEATDAAAVDRLVAAVARATEDHTLDWLVASADSPAGWLHSRI
jgi:L-aminopeptidase/D-esterase-like protein